MRDALTLIALAAVYWLEIYPQVRQELAGWERQAREISDALLYRLAVDKLSSERLNPEAAAFFAVLAPRPRRRAVVRLIVAYQVLYDYLDAVNEQPDATDLPNGLQLHAALTDAVMPHTALRDYYRRNPRRHDGGYVAGLARTCQQMASTLPSLDAIVPVLARATRRCGEAQSYNHAVSACGKQALIDWALALASGDSSYLWWELSAGGISCLAIHALLARAAEPNLGIDEAMRLDRAYFPAVCAISALLDSLADYHGDAGTDNHSFIASYRDSEQVGERLTAITRDAAKRVQGLPKHRRHAIILAGITSFYLSSPSVRVGFTASAARCLIRSVGPIAAPMRAVLMLRRYLHRKASAE